MALGEATVAAMFDAFIAADPEAAGSLEVAEARFPRYLASRNTVPRWYGELAVLDRAHREARHGTAVERLARRDLRLDRELTLIPAHALVELTTTVDELWAALGDAASLARDRASACLPRSLDRPRTTLVWLHPGDVIATRSVAPDEEAALRAAARGTSLVELAAGLGGGNPHARALDIVCRWIDDGVLAA